MKRGSRKYLKGDSSLFPVRDGGCVKFSMVFCIDVVVVVVVGCLIDFHHNSNIYFLFRSSECISGVC
jgi:hypothetical protein